MGLRYFWLIFEILQFLDFFRTMKGMHEVAHSFGSGKRIRANHSAPDCPILRRDENFFLKFFRRFLIEKNFGANLKTLILEDFLVSDSNSDRRTNFGFDRNSDRRTNFGFDRNSDSNSDRWMNFDARISQLIVDRCPKIRNFQLKNFKCEPKILEFFLEKMNLNDLEILEIRTVRKESRRRFGGFSPPIVQQGFAGLDLIFARAQRLQELSLSLRGGLITAEIEKQATFENKRKKNKCKRVYR